MPQPIEGELSDEDFSLLATHQLGEPVGIYRLKPLYIRVLRVAALFSLGLAISLLISLLIIGLIKRPGGQGNQTPGIVIIGFLLLVGLAIFLLFAGIFMLRVEIPCAQKIHIIIGEQGLLFVGKAGGNKDIEVIHWSDIFTIKEFRNQYGKFMIRYQENRVVSLDSMYQDIDEIIEEVRLRIKRVQQK